MGEVENSRRLFLERRDKNMRRRARRGRISTECATIILLPEDKAKQEGGCDSVRTAAPEQTKAIDVSREVLKLRGSHRGPPNVMFFAGTVFKEPAANLKLPGPPRVSICFETHQFIFDGVVSAFAYDPSNETV
jgi:hypothetical protein